MMPEKVKKALKKVAKKKGMKGERADAFVYGTMANMKKRRRRKKKREKMSNDMSYDME